MIFANQFGHSVHFALSEAGYGVWGMETSPVADRHEVYGLDLIVDEARERGGKHDALFCNMFLLLYTKPSIVCQSSTFYLSCHKSPLRCISDKKQSLIIG